ncbi:MAG: VWA domain-containing protein [Erysipelotrichaceae bacterium]|nr:VWA domain-containing protein [Erysipelotrichaceae bacterium]
MTQKKEDTTDIVFILDRSGSMGGRETDTIGGYNSFLSNQQAENGKARVTTVLFDDRIDLIHERIDIANVEPISNKEYFVRGSTALLDAIGKSVYDLQAVHQNEGKTKDNSGAIFVIITDGYENASHHYSYAQIRELIQHKTTVDEWQFIYLGADLSQGEDADRMGFDRDRQAHYDKSKSMDAFNSVSDSVKSYRNTKTIANNWRDNFSTMDESRDVIRKLPIYNCPEGRFLIASDEKISIGERDSITILGKSHKLSISPMLQRYRKISGLPIDGIIGQDILLHYQVILEPESSRVNVSFAHCNLDLHLAYPHLSNYDHLHLCFDLGHLVVMTEFHHTKHAFIFDTKAHYTTLRESLRVEPPLMMIRDFHLELGLFKTDLIEIDLKIKKISGTYDKVIAATVLSEKAFVTMDGIAGSLSLEPFKHKKVLVLDLAQRIFTLID